MKFETFFQEEVRKLAERSEKVLRIYGDATEAKASALLCMIAASDLFFAVLPDGSLALVKGEDALIQIIKSKAASGLRSARSSSATWQKRRL